MVIEQRTQERFCQSPLWNQEAVIKSKGAESAGVTYVFRGSTTEARTLSNP
jgi:hypothetical protein